MKSQIGEKRKNELADERQSTKNGSKNNATGGGNKKNVPVVAKKPKVVPVEPMAKIVLASDGTRTKRRADHDHVAPAIAPAPPRGMDIPSAKHSATSQPPPSPLLPQAVNQMVQWTDTNPDDYEQLPGSSPWLQARTKVSRLQPVKGSGRADHNSKKLLDKLDSWLQKRERNDLKSTSVLVLKMRLHCEGCIRKIRKALKKFEGVEDFAFNADRDLVAVLGAVNEEKLVWHLERDLKKEIPVVLSAKRTDNKEAAVPAADVTRKSTGAPVDEKHCIEPPVDLESKSKEGHPVASCAGIQGCVQRITPATPPPICEKDVNGRASDSVPVTNNLSSYGVHYYGDSGANHLLHQNPDTFMENLDMFNEENPHACSIISPLPKKDAAPAGDKKPPAEKKKEEDKKPKQTTVVLKIRLHCDGCIQNIRKLILKIKGVDSVNIEAAKELVAVTGTMDVKELAPYLKEKVKRSVQAVPPPTKKDDGGADKKEGKESGGGDKKESYGYYSHSYAVEPYGYHGGYAAPPASVYAHAVHEGYSPYPQHPLDPRLHTPQMFSDENPNACSVM
ncbi:hypothetical protein CDL15_Pgr002004 [Punica granatum]|uniref:HMA domain-containing protein n=1 Tax=Punica granatum TaxID=22663 RepID=A0A218XCI0_PUNGR|nr:hypothetical protein CDL15_Pgr002004 [Punica granatum]